MHACLWIVSVMTIDICVVLCHWVIEIGGR